MSEHQGAETPAFTCSICWSLTLHFEFTACACALLMGNPESSVRFLFYFVAHEYLNSAPPNPLTARLLFKQHQRYHCIYHRRKAEVYS